MLKAKTTKKGKCPACNKQGILKRFGLTFLCNSECAFQLAKQKKTIDKGHKLKRKQAGSELREFKANDKSVLMPKAQAAFNKFIRERDKDLPCISCQRFHSGQYHAGHYKTVGARGDIRFNEDNCHKQCSVCNNHLSANIAEYTPRLIEKIGQERFDKLLKVEQKGYTVEDLKEIIEIYKRKYKELKINSI